MRFWTIGIVTGALLLFAVQVCAINGAPDIHIVRQYVTGCNLVSSACRWYYSVAIPES